MAEKTPSAPDAGMAPTDQQVAKSILSLLQRAADPSGSAPLDNKAPKKRGKLGRNLIWVAFGLAFFGIFGIQMVKQRGSLEDKDQVAKIEQAKEADKAKDYDKRVDHPEAVADAAIESSKSAVPKPATPAPGTPLPRDADQLLEQDRAKLDTAWRAINAGTSGGNSTGANSSGNKGPKNPTDRTDKGSAKPSGSDEPDRNTDRPGFASYTAKQSDARGGLLTAAPATLNPTSARPGEPPEAAAVRAQALAMQQAQMRNATVQPAFAQPPSSDGNINWLNQQQGKTRDLATTIKAKAIAGKHTLFPGTVIQAVLEQALDTSLPGPIRARVTTAIYDSRTAQYLVVPRGSFLLGAHRSSVSDGQTRAMMAFDSLVTPDGAQVHLGSMSASDTLGVAGVEGTLNTHFWQRIGIATLLSIEGAAIEKYVGPVGNVIASGASSSGQATSSAGGLIVLQTANAELQRQYAVAPNITLPAGTPITVITTGAIEIDMQPLSSSIKP